MIEWNAALPQLRVRQAEALGAQLQYVWQTSAFYRDVWCRPPAEIGFENLPLVTKKDFHRALEAGFLGTNLSCPPEKLSHIHASSGTSGRPTYFGLTARDYAAWIRIFTRGFKLAGIRPEDQVLHAFAMSRGYAGAVPMIEAFHAMGCVTLPMGAEAGSVRLLDAIDRLRPRVLYASPSMARRLAAAHRDEYGAPASQSSIELVLTGGEPGAGDAASKSQLADMWGAEIRECGGGTDVSPLMVAECQAHDGLHFLAGDEVMFELVDPDTAQVLPIEDGAVGEIVYTHLFREASPVVRMRHGDVVEVAVNRCACGIEAPRIWFRGRSDDMLIVRGVKVFPSNIQAVVSQFAPALTGAFVVRRPSTAVLDSPLKVLCEASEPDDQTSLKERFEQRARQVIGVRIECELVQPGTLGADREQKAVWVKKDA